MPNDYELQDDLNPTKAHSQHPMSAEEANELFVEIKRVFNDRQAIIDEIKRNYNKYSENRISTSILNINNRLVNNAGAAIPFDSNVEYPITEPPSEPVDPYENVDRPEDTIIRTVDGIAIINSLLNINELDSRLHKAAVRSQYYINRAIKSRESDLKKEYTDGNGKYQCELYIDSSEVEPGTPLGDAYHAYDTVTRELATNSYLRTMIGIDDEGLIRNLITYVKNFTNQYVEYKKSGTVQNITSAFDYEVLHYATLLIDAENCLLDELCKKYKKATMTTVGATNKLHVTDPAEQHLQYNKAPFIGSTCNAVCVGICTGSCYGTCNGCGGCTSYCDYTCGSACIGSCQTECMSNNCKSVCGTECTSSCSQSCTNKCSNGCDTICVGNCTGNCTTFCVGTCTTGCNSSCLKDCNTGCRTECKEECGASCTNEAATKTVIANPNPPNEVSNSNRGYSGPRTRAVYVDGYSVPQVSAQESDGTWTYNGSPVGTNGTAFATDAMGNSTSNPFDD